MNSFTHREKSLLLSGLESLMRATRESSGGVVSRDLFELHGRLEREWTEERVEMVPKKVRVFK